MIKWKGYHELGEGRQETDSKVFNQNIPKDIK
jgi:hypothetical protein